MVLKPLKLISEIFINFKIQILAYYSKIYKEKFHKNKICYFLSTFKSLSRMNNNLIDKSQLGNKETIGSLKTSNNKSCSFSSSNKITLKELLPADYVPRKLDFSKNAIENDKKENPFNKRKLSLNTYNETNTKPLYTLFLFFSINYQYIYRKLKLKKNFICDKTECLNNRNIEFKDFELLSTKKIKTNEHSDDISQFGINHVELQGYQFITV